MWATKKKYSEDQGGYLAAIIAYYGFFSLFPLLLVFTTVLGFALQGHPKLEHSLVNSALGQFPVIGTQLRAGHLTGSIVALVLGICAALWAGMGVCLAGQNAMNTLWGISLRKRPGFLSQRVRALALLGIFGGGALCTSLLSGLATFGTRYGLAWKLGLLALSVLLNFVLFWAAYRSLTSAAVDWGTLRSGAIAAAIAYQLLQTLGGLYIGHVVKTASNTYGTFAIVIGLLSWIYLAAHILLLAAEGNVVASRGLYPRSIRPVTGSTTAADELALRQRAQVEEPRPDQHVNVTLDRDSRSPAPGLPATRQKQPRHASPGALAIALAAGWLAGNWTRTARTRSKSIPTRDHRSAHSAGSRYSTSLDENKTAGTGASAGSTPRMATSTTVTTSEAIGTESRT
jgi:membrane protein